MLESDDAQMMLEEVRRQLIVMKSYLEVRLDMQDWHGVADAAMDIREMEAKKCSTTSTANTLKK